MPKLLPTLTAMARVFRQNMLIVAMCVSSVFCLCILAMRMAYTHSETYSFMSRNLFLAWPSVISAAIAYKFHQKWSGIFRIVPLMAMGLWLVFLPNAPYLITDIVHFSARADISLWFDLTMFAAFAVTGLLYGSISVFWMQQLVVNIAGTAASWLFVLGVSALSSFGIYLGRFQRWNSWDVVRNPAGLLSDIWANIRHPVSHFQTYAFSALFTLFLMSVYLVLSALTHLSQENP